MGDHASWPKACMEWKAKQGDKMNQMLNEKQRKGGETVWHRVQILRLSN